MENLAVVRADFYSNGIIIPLGITYENGEVDFINQMLEDKISVSSHGNKIHSISCKSGERIVKLLYKDCAWKLVQDK